MNQVLIIVMLGLVSGIALGCIYTLLAISYNLVLAATGIFNFAQGVIVMAGTFFALYIGDRMGWPFFVAILVTALAGAALGLVTELVAVRPVMRRTSDLGLAAVITTLGLGLALISGWALVVGSDPQPVRSYVSTQPIFLGPVPVRPIYLVMIAATVIVALTIDNVLRRTMLGFTLRAVLEDPEGASLVGINTPRVIRRVFAAAGVLSAIAGYLVAPVTQASPFVADEVGLFAFAAMTIGGFGSFGGALAGGIIVGVLTGEAGGFLNPHLTRPLVFVICLLVLLVRPGGIFGTRGTFGTKVRDI
jgi:branched-subunit amino acid ABC-type transport system permease component